MNLKPNEIGLTRLYDANISAVWNAFTDTTTIGEWWGPRGFTTTTHKRDLRPGGSWTYLMHSPDGSNYNNHTTYLEVEHYKRLVYDHGANDKQPPMFRVTVNFSEVAGKTLMEMVMALPTAEAAIQTKAYIKRAGGDACWDRLGEFLAKKTSGKEVFIINRSFPVSQEKLFDLWTNPEHFVHWQAPGNYKMKIFRADIKPGGSLFYYMGDGEHVNMYGRACYLEIQKPTRILYTQQFCDEKENISRHPFAQDWPETMLTEVLFANEDSNQTRVTLTWQPHGKVSSQELQTFIGARTGMFQGWTASLDNLENYLKPAN